MCSQEQSSNAESAEVFLAVHAKASSGRLSRPASKDEVEARMALFSMHAKTGSPSGFHCLKSKMDDSRGSAR